MNAKADLQEFNKEMTELRSLVYELGALIPRVHDAADRAILALNAEGAVENGD